MKATIYHNPGCKKSIFALEFLERYNLDIDIKLYMVRGISRAEIYDILELLNCHVTDIVREKEPVYVDPDISEEMLVSKEGFINAIIENPSLLERPIILFREKGIGAIARSEEALLSLLKQADMFFDTNMRNAEINKKTESNKDKALEQDIV